MVVHRSAVAGLEVEHPGAEIIGAEEMDISILDTVFASLFDFLLKFRNSIEFSPSQTMLVSKLMQWGGVVNR